MTPLFKRLRGAFLRGLFIVGPIMLTIALLSWLVTAVDRTLSPVLGTRIPGLGIGVAVLIVLIVGTVGGNLVGRHVIELIEEALIKVPVFGGAYRMIKQLAEAFSPGGPAMFSGLALVEYPRPEVWSLGFVTKRFFVERDGKRAEMAAVYIPTNHVYIGDVIVVPVESLVETGLSQAEGVEVLVSGGAGLPDELKAKISSKKS